jgi:methylated-DNA-[protein]-cysteine S-methyltransferase
MTTYVQRLNTPIGDMLVEATDRQVLAIQFVTSAEPTGQTNDLTQVACQQLEAYFEGRLHAFDMPISPQGTPFQQRVWAQLLKVPYGCTQSYLQIACALDNRKLIRAVGAANGANPIAIVVPCHRIVGSGGSLVGYAGGIDRKKWLLEHEVRHRLVPKNLLF